MLTIFYLSSRVAWIQGGGGGGGNFHLKVGGIGGAKSSGNAGDPMLGVAVSGVSRIYKRGGGGGGGIK